ncbi:hypothetical protein ACFXGT_11480 [Streptomyces sp. NPDC059352]
MISIPTLIAVMALVWGLAALALRVALDYSDRRAARRRGERR